MPWKGVVSLLGELAVVSLLGELAVQSIGDSLGELPPTTGIVALKCFDEVLIDTEKQLSAGFERLFWFLREYALAGVLAWGLFLFLRECATWGSLPRLFRLQQLFLPMLVVAACGKNAAVTKYLARDISNDLDWRRLHISMAVLRLITF
jgi:hypothetical protein